MSQLFIIRNQVKSGLLVVFLVVLIISAFGESKSQYPTPLTAQEQANTMGQAFLKGDYETFARYTYPALLNAMGGETRMAATLRQTVVGMQAKGMSFSSIVVDSPSKIIKSGSEFQCTLQQHTTIKLANGRAVATSTLIAISKDGGKNWLFVDTSNKDAVAMRKALPNLSTAIVIPPQQKPAFYSF